MMTREQLQAHLRKEGFKPTGLGHLVDKSKIEVIAVNWELGVAFLKDPFNFQPTRKLTDIVIGKAGDGD